MKHAHETVQLCHCGKPIDPEAGTCACSDCPTCNPPPKFFTHCWADYRASLVFGSPEWAATFEDGGSATCMLPSGHTEPHEFTPDDNIVISFKELDP